MAGNVILNRAKDMQFDEYYTKREDVDKELRHYEQYLKGKTVICNCDDPRVSNFFRFFALNFKRLGLKKVISTCYKSEDADAFTNQDTDRAVYIVYDGTIECNSVEELNKLPVIPLEGDGDFRSPECVELLKEADFVCTNPPFSLLNEYIKQLIYYEKEFLIIAPTSVLHRKNIFPYIRDNKFWTGYSKGTREFFVPDDYSGNYFVDSNGKKYVKMGNTCWLTNLDTATRHNDYIREHPTNKYSPEKYISYDNFDGIDVDDINNIPIDYYGYMGVPDGFIEEFNPDQFEIVGIGSGKLASSIGVKKNYRGRTDIAYTTPDGEHHCPYSRIIIRRKV